MVVDSSDAICCEMFSHCCNCGSLSAWITGQHALPVRRKMVNTRSKYYLSTHVYNAILEAEIKQLLYYVVYVDSHVVSSGQNSLKKPQGGASGGGSLLGVFHEPVVVGLKRCHTTPETFVTDRLEQAGNNGTKQTNSVFVYLHVCTHPMH